MEMMAVWLKPEELKMIRDGECCHVVVVDNKLYLDGKFIREIGSTKEF